MQKTKSQKSMITPVRYAEKTLRDIDKLVEAGFYKSRSDALRDAARRLIREHYGLLREIEKQKTSVEIIREIRRKIWEDALSKAHGDEEKAARIIIKEANKIKI